MRLKATKTSLYRLALEYVPEIPPMRQMEFSKAPRSRSWFLRWWNGIQRHEVYFSTVAGLARLLLYPSAQVIPLSLDELRKYDLVDEDNKEKTASRLQSEKRQ
jgi:hypothetical protein